MPKVTITPAFVKNLTTLPGKARTEWVCESQPGLYLEARSTSNRGTWYYRYRDANKLTKHARLGDTDTMSIAEAKARAKDLRAEIQLGADPSGAAKKQKEVPTFSEFFEQDYLLYIRAKKRSHRDDENRVRQHLIPNFGNFRLNKITSKQISDFHLKLKQSGLKGATCDHHLRILKTMFSYAVRNEIITDNPAARVQLFREPNLVENYLTDEQLTRLVTVLHNHKNRTACQVILLLLSTGTRLNEALTGSWENIKLEKRTWKIEATISKNKKVRYVPLNDSAVDVLNKIQPDVEKRSGFLFINHRTGKRLATVHGAWRSIRKEANVPFMRIHDTRHLFASFLAESGRSLYEIQVALGHSSPIVTQRYAHLSQGAMLEASDAASQRIRAASPRLLPSALPADEPQEA